jgi:hypothetical protein
MHLGPLEVRETPSCGTYHTRRLALAVADPRDEPAALWVQFRPNQGAPRTALVDIRHARTFGLGRVDACAHGLPLSPDEAGEVEIHTVSREFVRGPVWRFRVDPATETQPLVPVEMPTEADLSQLENPFAPGYRTQIERVLSDDIDNAVLGAMVLLVVAASVAAWLFWAGRRRRKRHVAEIPCPSCEHLLSLDLGAPETDGMFCPACGKSSVFVTLEPDGTPRARVMKLAR